MVPPDRIGQAGGVTEQPREDVAEVRAAPAQQESLAAVLGGRRGALDATAPAVAFAGGWFLGDSSVGAGAAAALVVGLAVALWRLRRGDRPRAVVLGLLGVGLATVIALYTGRPEDFFLAQLMSNVGSVVVWAASILIRWPLLGVVVGGVLGQRTRWRRDPALLRAYSLASWIWVCQYLVRVAVFLPLWLAGLVGPLLTARVVLSWPLVALCLAVSWWVLRRALPTEHPGIRHPREAGGGTGAPPPRDGGRAGNGSLADQQPSTPDSPDVGREATSPAVAGPGGQEESATER